MKKFIRLFFIFFFNILLFSILLLVIDYLVVMKEYNIYEKSINDSGYKGKEHIKGRPFEYNLKMNVYRSVSEMINYKDSRRIVNPGFEKRPIILYGCSYAYGDFLDDRQTFGNKLSLQTSRPVYNFAYSGWGLQHMYFQLENENGVYSQINNPEYAIYVFMGDHIHRMHYHYLGLASGGNQLGYEKKGNKLIKKVPFFIQLNRLNFLKKIEENFIFKHYTLNPSKQDENFDLMKAYFIQSKLKLSEIYPDIKFLIIKYPYPHCNQWYYSTPRWKELDQAGFIVVDLKEMLKEDLLTDEYRLPDEHPNEKAWDTIVPELIKKIKL